MKMSDKGMKEFKANAGVFNLLEYVDKAVMILADNG